MIKNDKHCVSRAGASDRMSRFWKSFGTLDTSLDCLFHAHLLCALSSVWHQCTYCSFHRKLSLQRTYVTLHCIQMKNETHQGKGQPLLRFQAITGWQFGTNYAGHACASYRRRRSWTLSDKLDIEPLCCCEHLACVFGYLPQSCHTSHTSCSFLKWQIELNKVTEMQVWGSP